MGSFLHSIKKFLQGSPGPAVDILRDKEGNPCTTDVQLAVLVLLVEAAASDQDIPKSEAEVVCALAQEQLGFENGAIPGLIDRAVAIRREKGKLDEFVNTINDRFSEAQRQMIFAMIWKVLIADGQVDKFERRVGIQLQFRLQLDEDKADEARHFAVSGRI